MKRFLDLLIALMATIAATVPVLLIALIIKTTSRGPILYWSDRIGRNNRIFKMPKFRTMRTDTPQVATHLLTNPTQWLAPFGAFLRKSSLDELPQLLCILKGEMSLVGPRPALFNQKDLISIRTKKNIHTLKPGLTGWAQINGRDEIPLEKKIELDEYYLINKSIFFDLVIILKTAKKVIFRDNIHH